MPFLQYLAVTVDLDINRFQFFGCVDVEDETEFAGIDVVMQKGDAEIGITRDGGNSSVEIYPGKTCVGNVESIIEKGGGVACHSSRAHPAESSVRVNDLWGKSAAPPFDHNVVITQRGRVGSLLQFRGVIVTAIVSESCCGYCCRILF